MGLHYRCFERGRSRFNLFRVVISRQREMERKRWPGPPWWSALRILLLHRERDRETSPLRLSLAVKARTVSLCKGIWCCCTLVCTLSASQKARRCYVLLHSKNQIPDVWPSPTHFCSGNFVSYEIS